MDEQLARTDNLADWFNDHEQARQAQGGGIQCYYCGTWKPIATSMLVGVTGVGTDEGAEMWWCGCEPSTEDAAEHPTEQA